MNSKQTEHIDTRTLNLFAAPFLFPGESRPRPIQGTVRYTSLARSLATGRLTENFPENSARYDRLLSPTTSPWKARVQELDS